MKLSPLYRAVLAACPDVNWIYQFIPQLGRGRCSWIHGLTKTGQKISRFLKKGLIRFNTWLNDSEFVSLNRDCVYQVSQNKCTCPEWRHRISQNKAYRHIPDFFKGYVDICKHQTMQWLRQHDISHFSSFIEVEKNQTPTQAVLRACPEVEQQTYQIDCVNVPDGILIQYQEYWGDFQTFDVYYKNQLLGEIEVTLEGFEASTFKGFRHTFTAQESAINYLLKQNKISPTETDKLLEEQELQAMRDLFGDDMYPDPQPKPIQSQNKPQKKWLSFSDLKPNPEEINLLGDYGNWLEPDPAWDEF